MASRVVSLCVYIAEGVTAWQYFSHQFPPQRKAWQAGLGMAAAYGIAWALFTPYRMWSNTVLFTLANLLSLCVFFTCSWKASVFHSVLLTCLMVASELIVEIPLGVLLGGFEKYQTSFLVFSVLSAFSKLLYFMLPKLCTVFIKDTIVMKSMRGKNQFPESIVSTPFPHFLKTSEKQSGNAKARAAFWLSAHLV